MAQRIRRLTTDQEIAGSNPAGIVFFLLILFLFFSPTVLIFAARIQ